MAIRTHTGLSGIQLREHEHKISLYVDDVIIFLTNIANSVPNLIQQILIFGQFSGYQINSSKLSILFLNKEERQKPLVDIPYINAKEGFAHLGVKISPEV